MLYAIAALGAAAEWAQKITDSEDAPTKTVMRLRKMMMKP